MPASPKTRPVSGAYVLGDAIVDLVFGGFERLPDPGEEVVASQCELRPGGSAGYAAMGLAARDVDVRVATLVGTDALSERWLDVVGDEGVDTTAVERVPGESISTAAAFLGEDDRSFVTYRGAVGADRALRPDPGDADLVLVTGFSQAPYLWSEEVVAAIRALDDRDVPVCLDTNLSPSDWQPAFEAVAPAVDYLLVNEQEVRSLGDADDIVDAGRALCGRGVGTCVVKTGSDGCTLVDADGVERVDTETRETVDACGAGDFFNAGFVAGLLDGQSATTAAAHGNRCAGAAIGTFPLREKLTRIRALSSG